jgi:hypothetical protein
MKARMSLYQIPDVEIMNSPGPAAVPNVPPPKTASLVKDAINRRISFFGSREVEKTLQVS